VSESVRESVHACMHMQTKGESGHCTEAWWQKGKGGRGHELLLYSDVHAWPCLDRSIESNPPPSSSHTDTHSHTMTTHTVPTTHILPHTPYHTPNPYAQVHDYFDRRACKHFLLGCCPHDVFSKTKIDLGPCERVHKEELKEKFEAELAKGSSSVLAEAEAYERELERAIRELVHEADRKIQRGIKVRTRRGGRRRRHPMVGRVHGSIGPAFRPSVQSLIIAAARGWFKQRVEGEGGAGGLAVLVSGPEAFVGRDNASSGGGVGGGGGGVGGGNEGGAPPAPAPAPAPVPKPAVDISTHPDVSALSLSFCLLALRAAVRFSSPAVVLSSSSHHLFGPGPQCPVYARLFRWCDSRRRWRRRRRRRPRPRRKGRRRRRRRWGRRPR
jgi:hypothetical protein